jgi:glutamate dehydrogenase
MKSSHSKSLNADEISNQNRKTKDQVVEKVMAQLPEKERDGAIKVKFIQDYYSEVPPEDLEGRDAKDLLGAALKHFEFFQQFRSGAPKLRIYNPQRETDGWQSTHTVIEIINDNMPFLVDSVTMEINRQGLRLHLTIHPILETRRDTEGNLLPDVSDAADAKFESVMHLEVDRETDIKKLQELESGILRILDDVRKAVDDYPQMRQLVMEITQNLDRFCPSTMDCALVPEEKALLQWLAANHFTFLGYRHYRLGHEKGKDVVQLVKGSGLGILRETGTTRLIRDYAPPTKAADEKTRGPQLLVLTKANSRATVHRPGYLDYIGIKVFDDTGRVVGEHRFLGLLTSTAYNSHPNEIPLLRQKVKNIVERAGFDLRGHKGKALLTVLEEHPRDELFQRTEDELFEDAIGILGLGYRQRTRLFVRSDTFGRYLSCLVYVVRESFNTELRKRVEQVLMRAFNGISSEYSVHLSELPLARIHYVIRTKPGTIPAYDISEVEKQVVSAARRWQDELHDAYVARFGEEQGNDVFVQFGNAFPPGYQDDYSVADAVSDTEMMLKLGPDRELTMNLYTDARPTSSTLSNRSEEALRLIVFHAGEPMPLSSILPMLEHMGVKVLEQLSDTVEPSNGPPIYVSNFGMQLAGGTGLPVQEIKANFEEAFSKVWRGEMENDAFNRLVLLANLSWREVVVLRAYSKYLRQAGIPFSQTYMEQALTGNAAIARMLVELFKARFNPDRTEESGIYTLTLTSEISEALDLVSNLDEDRILRRFLALIQATTRTNYYQTNEQNLSKPYLSFKFDPSEVPDLPDPKPKFEIFVYSPRVEGVHLRGGSVARGGLRWSDRREDFRTEILGLMKAQMVKNTVIVPVGSKGGFVVKQPPQDREAYLQEGIACYKDFLRGLLDLTDNLVGGNPVPPQKTIRYDDDDPYLVVAADKGTAAFSDIANGVAKEYGFWLDDAFASGGSVGYDHKKMAITARGAWESVKRHFRELNIDIQRQDFTVVGIGDMSGDVFGNGMLLSKHIRLVGAFDHRHIFLDPNPDAASSFKERQRLFNLPRSSWADYDANLISKGGGIFPRTAKSIPLSDEVKGMLGITQTALTPVELIRALLKAEVDLLYNGGIGTYVKASRQTHADVGDRANDTIRVNGNDLRCRVVGEGGNLGFTQLGRIEYALCGGKINTDAIDNSAGVDCSDHEVNIKILLNAVVAAGAMTLDERNHLLAEMTNEVGELVLRDNYLQTQSLSVREKDLFEEQVRFIKALEKQGKLNRQIEFLPDGEEIAKRKASKTGLSSPERAVLLAYSKITLYEELLASDLPDDQDISDALVRYFPVPLRERFKDYMERHPLKREIIATQVVNGITNRVGSTFVHRMMEEAGKTAPDVVRAYLLTRGIFDFVSFWQAVESLDNQVPDSVQAEMLQRSEQLATRATLWFLRYRNLKEDIEKTVHHFVSGVKTLAEELDRVLPVDERTEIETTATRFINDGVPKDLAWRLVSFDTLFSALDIVEASIVTQRTVQEVAGVYFALGTKLDLSWVRAKIADLPGETHWQEMAKTSLNEDISHLQTELTGLILKQNRSAKDATTLIAGWELSRREQVDRCQQLLADLKTAGTVAVDLSMLSVAVRELKQLQH